MIAARYLMGVALLAALVAPPLHADDPSPACALTDANGDANNCYTITPPFNDGSGITINGTEGVGEWAGATTKSLGGDMSGTLKAFRSNDAIYLLISVNDSSYNAADQIRIFVDPQHNHAVTADDVEFRIVRDTGASPNHRRVTGSGDAAWHPDTLGSLLGTSNGVSSWTVEVKLTAAELGLNDLPPILGIGIQAEDNPNGNLSLWPANFNNANPAATWANMKTRYPIKYMLVLDRSGSMDDQNKWTNTKKAANFFANTMSILRDPAYFTDKLGVVTFTTTNVPSYACSTSNDVTAVNKSLTPIGAFPVGDYVGAPPGIGNPDNCTPVGSGLNHMFGAVGTSATDPYQRVALLMSDGMHNAPSSTKGSPADLGLTYSACNAGAWSTCPNSAVQVNTIALGQDSGVDSNLLNQIKTHYSGTLSTTYNVATNVEDLKESFISSLDNLYQMNLASVGASGSEFVVDPHNRKLVVILSWTTPASAVAFKLQQRANPGDPWHDVNCAPGAFENSVVGYSICSVTEPVAGTWRAVDSMKNPLMSADRQFVLLDLSLRARFAVDQVVHGTGMDILLTADLRERGVPVTNDPASHPVTVTVTIDKPSEGFGTVAATHALDGCKLIEPQLPSIETARQTRSAIAPAGTATAGPPGVDPPTSRFALMQQLLKACGKNGLGRAQESGLQLYDDGTHGDATANDGVYTLRFTNTQYEGSYLFRFDARGTSPAGSAFTRTKQVGEYVRLEVDPTQTAFGSRILSQNGNIVLRQYFVTPRDRFSGYLGPGYPEQIQFHSVGGQWMGTVQDHNSGIYSQVLRYDARQGEPLVTPNVQGKAVGKPVQCDWRWLWLMLLILLVLVLIIVVLLVRRRQP